LGKTITLECAIYRLPLHFICNGKGNGGGKGKKEKGEKKGKGERERRKVKGNWEMKRG
jgi:hypothetical protein